MAKARGKRAGTTPRVRDPDATRAALLDSAVKLFAKQGYDATSVQQVVDDAQRTKGAFYHYFDSKEDLLQQLHNHSVNHQLELVREVLARDDPADVLLEELVTTVLMEPMGLYKSEISVFNHELRRLTDKGFEDVLAKRDEFEACVVEIIERGVASGVFKDLGPPRLLAFGIIGMCSWSHTWLEPDGDLTPRAIGEMFAALLVSGLKA
ncbi:TetR/AcrR family transcriptional regulator [Mycolicibacterium litorale]|uniref:TetR family transcriptional regulator n=1 Tax=Mycolicibacterium litorale TaxID=758802 RepID=A0AAD1MUG3_9MYCO|nr:TetR/AcrR family transcriptional regulator [Mycolicibacterium litorale]MCV7416382.1 TetR/AcrR family transcriptional regulator [Mycolicibacterium litorale]TDY09636.1 TetR family transcriptional regulator [Mycolicibacterium litorale]BBY17580.1 TetR family transcriptional regulator [Mycolicibacterium litorale]